MSEEVFAGMEVVVPAPPQQDNYSDCGVFLLHYVDWMFARLVIDYSFWKLNNSIPLKILQC